MDTNHIQYSPEPGTKPGDIFEMDDAPLADDGYSLKRTLKQRHVNMMAFSTCLGIGLFLQSGKVIFLVGPGLATIAYLVSCLIMWTVISSLGEMVALFPIEGGFFLFIRRFVDEAMGYAAGWMAWFSFIIYVATELLAVAYLFKFHFDENYLHDVGYPEPTLQWSFGQATQPAIWVFIFWIIMIVPNCLPVLWYGDIEYILGSLKIIFLIMLIVFNVVMAALNRVPHDNGKPWTYSKPYGFSSENMTLTFPNSTSVSQNSQGRAIEGSLGIFLAFWSSITTIVFSMAGMEIVAVSAAETANLAATESIKMGTRKIVLRVGILYVLATFTVGFNVPYTDWSLRDYAIYSVHTGNHSAFIIAIVRSHIRTWPHILNAFFIYSATSCGMNNMYAGSRILHALALCPGAWPNHYLAERVRQRLLRTSFGVPYAAVFTSAMFGLLGFLAVRDNPANILGRIARTAVITTFTVYALNCLAYLRFYKVIQRAADGDIDTQGIRPGDYNRKSDEYPYKSRGQPLKAMVGLVTTTLVVLFHGWETFKPFKTSDFIASYISILIFCVLTLLFRYRLTKGAGWKKKLFTLRPNNDITSQPPISVERQPRIGRLDINAGLQCLTLQNVSAIIKWLWAWMK